MDTKNAKEALKNFTEWLKAKEGPVVLFVHNGKLFDCKCIIYSLENVILLVPLKVLWWFVDTLIMLQKIMSQREKYSHESSVAGRLGTAYRAHDSFQDVSILQQFFSYKEVNGKGFKGSSFTINYAINSTKCCLNKAVNIHSLQPLITSKVISIGMGDMIAISGLMLNHLKLSFIQGRNEGLRSVLTARINGKPRVTTSSRTIMELFNHLKKYVKGRVSLS